MIKCQNVKDRVSWGMFTLKRNILVCSEDQGTLNKKGKPELKPCLWKSLAV